MVSLGAILAHRQIEVGFSERDVDSRRRTR